jgi:hypothetical protein
MGNRPKAPSDQARLAVFAIAALREFVDKYRAETKTTASPVDVLGALVLAGRDLPVGVVRELVDIYNTEAAKHIPPS